MKNSKFEKFKNLQNSKFLIILTIQKIKFFFIPRQNNTWIQKTTKYVLNRYCYHYLSKIRSQMKLQYMKVEDRRSLSEQFKGSSEISKTPETLGLRQAKWRTTVGPSLARIEKLRWRKWDEAKMEGWEFLSNLFHQPFFATPVQLIRDIRDLRPIGRVLSSTSSLYLSSLFYIYRPCYSPTRQ